MELMTSSSGSYPRVGTSLEAQKHRQAYAQLERGEISAADFERVQDEVTREVIAEQVKAGLDIVTDGQVRWYDPISHISRTLGGCKINGLLRFFDTNFYFRQPVIHGKLEAENTVLKKEFAFAKEISMRPVKPVVIGPYTLAKLSIDRRQGSSLETLVSEFADIIANEVAGLAGAGAQIIQVDEPAILKHPKDFEMLSEAIETVAAEKGKSRLALYTYFADAAPLYDKLLSLPVDAIGLDFTYSPKLPRAIETHGCDLDICLGLINGRNTWLEKLRDVQNMMRRILPVVGGERVYLNPSCGLGDFLPREIAYKKLENMVAIAEKIKGMML